MNGFQACLFELVPVEGVSITTSHASPQALGTPITFTAAGQGGSGSYEYRFYINSGSGFLLQKDYSTSNIWIWTPSATGAYDIFVEVRNAGTTVLRGAYNAVHYYQIM